MMDRYLLLEHCRAIRRFLLLGQGDFVESLIDLAEGELRKDASEIYQHQLMGILDMAIRQSNAQFCHPDVLARLGVKLHAPAVGEIGWAVFLLDYAIDSPLHVVFTPSAMRQYGRAFTFFWKLRRVSHALASCWSQHMTLQHHLVSVGRQLADSNPGLGMDVRRALHQCTCLRNEMHHFFQNVYSYVMCEVLESAWDKLQSGWARCTDLNEVIDEHQRYLACLEEGAFLAPPAEPILTGLNALFALALQFTELHDRVCASAFEAVEVYTADGRGSSEIPIARSLSECRARVEQISGGFLLRVQSLLRALEGQPPLRYLSSDLRFLRCRLDFSEYYEQKRTAPLAERLVPGGSG